MGKYLQDIRFELENKGDPFSDLQKQTQAMCSLIEVLFNYHLPAKFEIGPNIWRIQFILTADEHKDLNSIDLGLLQCFLHFQIETLKEQEPLAQKTILLSLLFKGLFHILKKYSIALETIHYVQDKILNDKILFNDYYKERKKSPNKKLFAQLKGYYSENYADRKTFLTVLDQDHIEIKSILIGHFNFQAFDRIKWLDHQTVWVYHINTIQSYKSKRVAEDYFEVNIETAEVKYQPVTKESMFDYGVQLLTETDEYDKAMEYLQKVRAMGHGKVENIFKNLALNPLQRNKSILLQAPSGKIKNHE